MMDNLRDAAAERGVLGGVCTYGADAYADVSDLVSGKSFAVDSNQIIWACLEHIFQENPKAVVDYPTIMSAAQSLGLASLFDPAEEKAHLRAVMNVPVKQESVRPLAAQVKKLEFIRQAYGVVDGVRDDILTLTETETFESIMARIEGPILDILSLLGTSTAGPQGMSEGVRHYAEYLAKNVRDVVGIKSGYREYDRAIGGGFRPGVSCIGARPKVGKTMLGMNMGVRVASGAGY